MTPDDYRELANTLARCQPAPSSFGKLKFGARHQWEKTVKALGEHYYLTQRKNGFDLADFLMHAGCSWTDFYDKKPEGPPEPL